MVTPVPIPNTEVKHCSGDNTMAERSGKIARCWAFSFIGTFYRGFAGDFSIIIPGKPPFFFISRIIKIGGLIHPKNPIH